MFKKNMNYFFLAVRKSIEHDYELDSNMIGWLMLDIL